MSTETITSNDNLIKANTEQILANQSLVYEAGKKDEHDKFWDTFQDYGKRADYQHAFHYWNCDYIRPKYKVVPTVIGSLNQMFTKSKIKKIEAEYFDFSQVPIGTSISQGNYYIFSTCEHLKEIEDIGFQPNLSYHTCFAWCYALKTIAKIRSDETITWTDAFTKCTSLENLTIEGTIGKNGFNVKDSKKLTTASLLSILKALSKDSTVASGKSITFATAHQAVIEADAQCLEQLNLAVNAGWTIAYA